VKFSVIASSPSLELSGANVLVANLLDELAKSGVPTKWVVTAHNPAYSDAGWLGQRRFKIESLRLTRMADVQSRQKLLLKQLEENSPCIFLPNFDFDMACAIPALSLENKAALILHCDDPVYHQFTARHGKLFNAIICVSEFLAEKLRAAHPQLSKRTVHIPFGVESPVEMPARKIISGASLQVAYCGRISFHQKRVQDLAEIINHCHEEKLPVKFHIAGSGPDEKEFFSRIAASLAAGNVSRLGFLPNADVLKLLSQSDVLLMTSDFEGLPVVLLEAMSRGCVPVVTRTDSGMGEVVQDGKNGFLLPVGDVAGFVERLTKLSADPGKLRKLQRAAFERIRNGGFTLERAAADYKKLFESLMQNESRWAAPRGGHPIIPPQYHIHRRIFGRLKKLAGAA
jgi:glycosyltransferase involved in cell wall biosynthesis